MPCDLAVVWVHVSDPLSPDSPCGVAISLALLYSPSSFLDVPGPIILYQYIFACGSLHSHYHKCETLFLDPLLGRKCSNHFCFQYHLWDIICKKVFQDLKYLPFSYDYVLFLFPRLRDFLHSSPIPVFQHFRFLLSFSLFRLSFTKIRYFLILFSKILRISDFLLGLPRLPSTRGVGGVLIGAPSNTIVSV